MAEEAAAWYGSPMNEQPAKRTWTVKLERSGGDQIVRIPGEIALPGEEAVLRRDGESVVLVTKDQAKHPLDLFAYLDALEPLAEEFERIPDAPPEPVKL